MPSRVCARWVHTGVGSAQATHTTFRRLLGCLLQSLAIPWPLELILRDQAALHDAVNSLLPPSRLIRPNEHSSDQEAKLMIFPLYSIPVTLLHWISWLKIEKTLSFGSCRHGRLYAHGHSRHLSWSPAPGIHGPI